VIRNDTSRCKAYVDKPQNLWRLCGEKKRLLDDGPGVRMIVGLDLGFLAGTGDGIESS
jgi:hypothetical protein